ncbi:methyltransferase domain-containing protein [Streptomyces syringium]|uniref:methyltransferase domain-containing protein n=1 Tax=Streptomyces syringium TaxID=76729 RepID=UPI003453FA6A
MSVETPPGTGALTTRWAPVRSAVPRAAFLPRVIWAHDLVTDELTVYDRDRDPHGWQAAADSDDPLVTQWDDGHHSGTGRGKMATSSSSMPSLVVRMLTDLDPRPGQRVLEIGTGTGWNAALLAQHLGAGNVVTIEVDPALAEAARAALQRAGLPVEAVHGDGFAGYPAGAPYDRIIATCGLRSIPYAWIEQTRPGGVILVPWGTPFSPTEALARLTVDGATASGRFTRPVTFMNLRDQRRTTPPVTRTTSPPRAGTAPERAPLALLARPSSLALTRPSASLSVCGSPIAHTW